MMYSPASSPSRRVMKSRCGRQPTPPLVATRDEDEAGNPAARSGRAAAAAAASLHRWTVEEIESAPPLDEGEPFVLSFKSRGGDGVWREFEGKPSR
jgi:hypothetical protein